MMKQEVSNSNPPDEFLELRNWILEQNTGKEGIMVNNLNYLMRLYEQARLHNSTLQG